MSVDASAVLRDRGYKVTAQRLAVLRAVSDRPHLTADEVVAMVRDDIGVISRKAVYDAVGVLVDSGLLRRIQLAGSAARYEDRVGDNHHHLVCRSCGELVDIDCAVGDTPCLTAADGMGYEIDEAEVTYWGLCPTCRTEPSLSATTSAPHGSPSGPPDIGPATGRHHTTPAPTASPPTTSTAAQRGAT